MDEILQNILSNQGIGSSIERADEEINHLRKMTATILRREEVEISPLLIESSKLLARGQHIGKELAALEELHEIVRNMTTSLAGDVSSTFATISNSRKIIDGPLQHITQVTKNMQNVRLLMAENKFFEAATILHEVDQIFANYPNTDKWIYLDEQVSQYTQLCREILGQMDKSWAENVVFDIDDTQSDKIKVIFELKKSGISISKNIIAASAILNSGLVTKISKEIRDKILLPVTTYPSNVTTKENNEFYELHVEILPESTAATSYLSVINRILTVLKFLKDGLHTSSDNQDDLMSSIGKCIAKEVIESLTKNCLIRATSSYDSFNSFGEVVVHAEKFQTELQAMGFLPNELSTFIEDAYDFNVLFANKFYISHLSKAREIMKKDINLSIVSDEMNLDGLLKLPKPILEAAIDKFNLKRSDLVWKPCQISASVKDVIELIDGVVGELLKSEESRAVRLLNTVRNILEMYAAVVPAHHKKLFESIPQQTALFHNNCLYMAHYALKLAINCYSTWPDIVNEQYYILLDQALSLRQVAASLLEKFVVRQRAETVSSLKLTDFLLDKMSPSNSPEMVVRKSLRTLQLLRSTWSNVLQPHVYENAMAFLVDAFAEEVVTQILAVEDISSKTALELDHIFNIVEERLPSIFPEPNEVYRICRKWGRFRELHLVLGGNLGDIMDRWADGAGPLACEFTPEEMKHLIRALFQNTERRAGVLARIK